MMPEMSGIPAGAGSLIGKRLGKYEILALLALGGTAEIYLARIVPGASVMRLIEPRLAVGRRLKSATGAAVILLTRIPVTVIRFACSAVHESPGTQV